jgi:hypothetical protein
MSALGPDGYDSDGHDAQGRGRPVRYPGSGNRTFVTRATAEAANRAKWDRIAHGRTVTTMYYRAPGNDDIDNDPNTGA